MTEKKITRYKSEFKKLHEKVCQELDQIPHHITTLNPGQPFESKFSTYVKFSVLQEIKDWFDEAQEAAEPAEPLKPKK